MDDCAVAPADQLGKFDLSLGAWRSLGGERASDDQGVPVGPAFERRSC